MILSLKSIFLLEKSSFLPKSFFEHFEFLENGRPGAWQLMIAHFDFNNYYRTYIIIPNIKIKLRITKKSTVDSVKQPIVHRD